MIKVSRDELKANWKLLIDFIQKNHVMEPCVEEELFINNKPVIDLCHTRGYFIMFGEWYVQYSMAHVIMDVQLRLIGRAVEEVIFYDTYAEYESARVRAMSGTKNQTGIHLN
jgi:hypothetical protein